MRSMSGESSHQQGSPPFGYSFQEIQDQAGPSNPLEPTGPPLLNSNESNLLDIFFDDPNSIPQGLPGKEVPNDGWAYPGDWNWDNGTFPEFNIGSTPHAENGHIHHDMPVQNASNIDQHQPPSGHRNLIPATSEVYNAAASLVQNSHGQTNRVWGGSGYPVQGSQYSQQMPTNGGHGYNYGNASFNSSESSPFNPFTASFVPQRPTPNDATNPYLSSESQASQPWREPPKLNSLRFGSDDNFQSKTYVLPKGEKIRDVKDTMIQTLEIDDDREDSSRRAQPGSARSKRRKLSVDSEEEEPSPEEDAGSSEYEDRISKRRRRRGKDEDEPDGRPSSKGKASRLNMHNVGKSKTSGMKSPAKRRNSNIGLKTPRQNLTDDQKRANHIASEQKRRNQIQTGYNDLSILVPGCRQGGLSKSNILTEAIKFLEDLQRGNDELKYSLDNG